MKTTITLPDDLHKELKKLAIERTTHMADLIVEAVRSTFFLSKEKSKTTVNSKKQPDDPLYGILKGKTNASWRDTQQLKKLWKVPS